MKSVKTFVAATITVIAFFSPEREPALASSFAGESGGVLPVRQDTATATADSVRPIYEMPQVDVIGREPGFLDRVPGSASIVPTASLDRLSPLSGNDVLRTVGGLHALDEEGAGLRLNLGIRGLDPDRSRTLLMLEDGVPIALAPYGEPEMYYTPSIDRMTRVEVLKGSGSILFGPQTIGGIVNYITADPPAEPSGLFRTRVGPDGFFTALLGYGTTVDNTGIEVNYLHRRADRLAVTGFRIGDLSSKVRIMLGERSLLGLKLAGYDEQSNSTYVGLTQTMYDSGEYFTQIAPDDELKIRRYSGSVTYDYAFSPGTVLRTTLFGYTTTRHWRRQEFGRTAATPDHNGVVFGDTSIPGGAIYMRDRAGNRNREFEVAGFEPRFTTIHRAGGVRNELDAGFRLHYERAFEQLIVGSSHDASSGELREDEIRTGYAASAFAQNRIYLTDRFILSPGLRLESFFYDRNILRGRYAGAVTDTNLSASDEVVQLIPGLGANFQPGDGITLFAGVHRGFAPPRVKDAVTSSGGSLNLDAELSWNYEVGVRYSGSAGFSVEATAFLLDFSNQVIPVSQSSGGSGTGLVNGGRSRHSGAEAGMSADLGPFFSSAARVLFDLNATIVSATYSADRFLAAPGGQVNIRGNTLPYAPELHLSSSIAIAAPLGSLIQFTGNYIGPQFSDEFNSVEPAPSGLTGEIPGYFILDLSTRYDLRTFNSTISLAVKNLLDERYIASRRPSGIKVGVPRMLTAGIEIGL